VATGHGEPALLAAQHVGRHGRVLGTDLSPEMIEVARTRADRAGVENVEFRVQDAERTDVGDEVFDVAVSRNSLMFMPDPLAAVRGMYDAVRRGGRACIAVVGPPETQRQWNLTVETLTATLGVEPPPQGAVGEPGVYAVSDVGLLGDLFTQAGFADVETSSRTLVYDFEKPRDIVDWHLINPTILGIVSGQEQDAVDRAWDAVVDAAAALADDDGHVRIPSEILYVHGTRGER
jgi:SAM-dependent methyltransferase